MKLHTNLSRGAIVLVTRHIDPVVFRTLDEAGSKQRARSFNIRLEGSGGRNNTGHYGAGDYDGATWDEWGAIIGAIYAFDPTAVWGGTSKRPVYMGAEHYHWLTNDRFRNGDIPQDTHARHGWVQQHNLWWHCKKCSAKRPGWSLIEAVYNDPSIIAEEAA